MTALHKWTVTRRREIYRSITFTILRAHLTWAFVAFFSRQIFQPTLVNGIYWVILPLLRLLRLRSIQFAAGPFLSIISTLWLYPFWPTWRNTALAMLGRWWRWCLMMVMKKLCWQPRWEEETTFFGPRCNNAFWRRRRRRVWCNTRAHYYVVCWITYICCFV